MRFSTVVVSNHFPRIVQRLVQVRDHELEKAAHDIRDIAKGYMEGPKSGRIYNYNGRIHRASAPGESPAILENAVHGNLQGELVKPSNAAVWSEEKHAPHLEYGTRNMAPRPFLFKAAKEGTSKLVIALSKLEGKLR